MAISVCASVLWIFLSVCVFRFKLKMGMASELLFFFFNRNFTTTAPETLENLGFFFFFKRSTVSRVCELWQFIITRIHDCSLEMCLGQFYHACSYYFCFYLLAIFSNKFSYFYFSSYKQTGSFIWATTTLSKHLLRMNEWTLWRHHTTMLTASSHL